MINNVTFEPLEDDELHFLHDKCHSQRREFRKIVRACLILQFILPIIVTTQHGAFADEIPSKVVFAAYGTLITFILLAIVMIGSYTYLVYPVKRDLHRQQKRIESCTITEKKHMALNNTWHFYINSMSKISIEVNSSDFDRFEVGDEINVEFAHQSGEYLGYF
jgi:hypothetical protein